MLKKLKAMKLFELNIKNNMKNLFNLKMYHVNLKIKTLFKIFKLQKFALTLFFIIKKLKVKIKNNLIVFKFN